MDASNRSFFWLWGVLMVNMEWYEFNSFRLGVSVGHNFCYGNNISGYVTS